MPLTKGFFAGKILAFMRKQQQKTVTDADQAMQDYANAQEDALYSTLKGATFIIPAGTPILTSQGPGTITVPTRVTVQ